MKYTGTLNNWREDKDTKFCHVIDKGRPFIFVSKWNANLNDLWELNGVMYINWAEGEAIFYSDLP